MNSRSRFSQCERCSPGGRSASSSNQLLKDHSLHKPELFHEEASALLKHISLSHASQRAALGCSPLLKDELSEDGTEHSPWQREDGSSAATQIKTTSAKPTGCGLLCRKVQGHLPSLGGQAPTPLFSAQQVPPAARSPSRSGGSKSPAWHTTFGGAHFPLCRFKN